VQITWFLGPIAATLYDYQNIALISESLLCTNTVVDQLGLDFWFRTDVVS
jgi:hypothetical protein